MVFLNSYMIIKTSTEYTVISTLVYSVHLYQSLAQETVFSDYQNTVLPDIMNVIEYYIWISGQDLDTCDASLNLASFYLSLIQAMDADADTLDVGYAAP